MSAAFLGALALAIPPRGPSTRMHLIWRERIYAVSRSKPAKVWPTEPMKLVFDGRREGHRYRVTLRQRPLSANEQFDSNGLGVAYPQPETEICAVAVLVDGKPWPATKDAWSGLYSPNLEQGNMTANLSRRGDRLYVLFVGADAGDSYFVRWTFRRNGRDSRQAGALGEFSGARAVLKEVQRG